MGFVFFDIEATDLSGRQLLQITAVAEDNDTFDLFIKPELPDEEIPLRCTELTGFTILNGVLHKKDKPVPCVSIKDALKDLNFWLSKIRTKFGPINLVGYNSHGFDNRALIRQYKQTRTPFPQIKTSFDILPKIRKTYPKSDLVENHKLETIAKIILTDDPILTEPDFHSSLFDCQILKAICNKICNEKQTTLTNEFNDCAKPFSYFLYHKL